MAFSSAELTNIANAALDYYIDKGKVHENTLADKPLLQKIEAGAAVFPGGKENVSLAVKGAYGDGNSATNEVAGYTHNDTVSYINPANILRVNYPWKEHHTGISVTLTELKKDGISVVDSIDGKSTSNHSGREQHALANLLEDKLSDMMESYARGMNTLLYGDGTGDANAFAGIRAFIKDDPTAGSVGGLAATNTWWRSRANLAISTTATGDELVQLLHQEMRQLRRFGGRPDIAVAGSAFLDRLGEQIRAKGNYTQTGFSSSGATDISMAEISYGGLKFVYDPALDDLTVSGKDPDKRCYIIDSSKLKMHYMQGEKMKRHSPARSATQYVMYRAITTTCVMCSSQLNCHGVYEIS